MNHETTLSDTLKSEIKAEIAQALGLELYQLPFQLNSTQAAKVLNVKPTTLAVWRSTGRHNLPFVKISVRAYYDITDLLAFIAQNRFQMKCLRRYQNKDLYCL